VGDLIIMNCSPIHSSVPSGLRSGSGWFPTLKRWAIITCPYGTGITFSLILLLSCIPSGLRAASTNDESQLIRVLESNASPREKDAACARLKLIGTPHCVPALGALLTDEHLSHSARYALEPMPYAEAGRALTEALGKTTGPTRVGIISSLGARGETKAAPALAGLLKRYAGPAKAGTPSADTDVITAAAAATALGQIGSASAVTALQDALAKTSGAVHVAVVDANLRCANRIRQTIQGPRHFSPALH